MGSQVCLPHLSNLYFKLVHLFYNVQIENAIKIKVRFPRSSPRNPGKADLGDRRQSGHRERSLVSQKHASPAALLYGTRPAPSRCRRLKPANMAVTYYFSRGVAVLAGLLLLSFGSLATSQIEVGVRPSEPPGPGRTALSGP